MPLTIKNFFKLIRYPNLLIIAFTQLIVRVFLIEHTLPFYIDTNFLLMVLATLLVASAGYIINDYFDVKIDQINKPNEVFIGHKIKRRTALLLHQVFSGVALVISFFIGKWVFLLNIFSIATLWFYASMFKKKPFIGNLIVAALTALTISQFILVYQNTSILVHVYALFAFFMNLIREIIKDMEDIRGDKAHGARTLPIVLGLRKTKKVIYVIVFLLIANMLYFSFRANEGTLWVIFSILLVTIVYMTYNLVMADRKKHFAFLSRLCKIIMIVGVLSICLF
jgi:4-hydroxybenzoate polyprenyltransferase